MVTTLKEVDAVVIGQGLTGVMMAKELTMAGLTVVGLERGPDRRPEEEVVIPRIRDELKYNARKELMIDNAMDTVSFRNNSDQQALPIRRWGAFSRRGRRRHDQSLGRIALAISACRISASAAK